MRPPCERWDEDRVEGVPGTRKTKHPVSRRSWKVTNRSFSRAIRDGLD